ncbi:Sodium/glucose cotransporter [Planctomycetes bacterium CA13]|uniref:Sodium/glucose cotransporter n=1 Tax=Novipirellula herctigrandis TaxID=2527986 RepID=A0A5C5Z9Z1_9BACT|nr:Sodium/glucose cotransporter [Planctomycetes bacterium CA13]
MGILDIVVFVGFVISVISIGLWKSRDEDNEAKDAQDYFLAGRGLTWYLVGFSLIAANISTEQFVGMTGSAANWLGMAIASYEWMAAATLVVTAFVFLPVFLKSGIYTIPEFLEYRYNTFARSVMAVSTMVILVGVPTASVIYSGAKVISVFFEGQILLGLDLGSITVGCWIIGILAAAYVFAGGLKACAWADLIQGAALIVGGAILAYLAVTALGDADPEKLAATARNQSVTAEEIASQGGIERFFSLNSAPLPEGKLHMVRPADDPEIPWTALMIGLWIPNFFYWGLNQYITQRTLGSKSLAEGQKGIIFAAALKLIIPFIVVMPGIMAFNLYNEQVTGDYDSAFPLLLKNLLTPGSGLLGFVLAAIFGAVVSSLASMLNSASTIFTMDIYNKLKKSASQTELVRVGRACTIVFVLIALLIAPRLDSFGGIFAYIQEFQGFISPGILAIFIFGILVHRAPRWSGTVGLLLCPILYGTLKLLPQTSDITFLNRMAICFGAVLAVLTVITLLFPLKVPVVLPVNKNMDLTGSKSAKFFGGVVIVSMFILYAVFY